MHEPPQSSLATQVNTDATGRHLACLSSWAKSITTLVLVLLTVSTVPGQLANRAADLATAASGPSPTPTPPPTGTLGSVSAAVVLPGDDALAPAVGKQETPKVARGGEMFLAVWVDQRTMLDPKAGSYNWPLSVYRRGGGSMSDVYATRLDATGNIIDRHPIILSQAPGDEARPQVSWDGQNWLVIWSESYGSFAAPHRICGVRISPAGEVLDPVPLTIPAGREDYMQSPSLHHDGHNWVVAWTQRSQEAASWRVVVARVTPGGAVLDREGVVIYEDASSATGQNADLASNGSGFLLVYHDTGDKQIKGVRFGPALQLIEGPFRLGDTSSADTTTQIRVVSSGPDYLVVWDTRHEVDGGNRTISACRVPRDSLVHEQPVFVIDGNVGPTASSPAIARSGDGWSVIYESSYDAALGAYGPQKLYLKPFPDHATVPEERPVSLSDGTWAQRSPAVASAANGKIQLLWQDARAEQDVYAAQITLFGSKSNEQPVSLGAPRHSQPRIAYGAGSWLAVYQREVAGRSEIYSQRLAVDGTPISSPRWVTSSPPAGTTDHRNPAVAFNGTDFLIVWDAAITGTGARRVFAMRYLSNGATAIGSAFVIADAQTPDVAALGTAFCVVGKDWKFIRAVRVSASGSVLGSSSLFGPSLTGFVCDKPRIIALGNRWLLAWQVRTETGSFSDTSSVDAAFLTAQGSPSGSFRVTNYFGGRRDGPPSLASSGDEALVVWSGYRTATGNRVRGCRITAAGTLRDGNDGFIISHRGEEHWTPAVTWDGSRYIATWLDQREEPAPWVPRGDIYGARIGRDATVYDPDGFVVANSAMPEETPFVASANGTTLFAYTAFYDHAPFSAMRVAVRHSTFTDLQSVSLPPSAPRGSVVYATVGLNKPAPSGGVVIALESASPEVLLVPSEVLVPAGASAVAFTARTTAVPSDLSVAVTAKSAGISRTAPITITVLSTFAQWQQVQFDRSALNHLAISAADADPDGDGRCNLLEYALGSDPHAAEAEPISDAARDADHFALTYQRRIGATDIEFEIDQSPDLAQWFAAPATEEVISSDYLTETVRAKVPIDSATTMFLRLGVSR